MFIAKLSKHTYGIVMQVSHLYSAAAISPVSPTPSEPVSGAAALPSTTETAPLTTRGRYWLVAHALGSRQTDYTMS